MRRKPKSKPLPPLSLRGKQILSLVLNSVAFGTHAEIGDVDALAEELKTTPGRLRPMLCKLTEMGYLTIEGKVAERVLPTVAAIRWQSPKVSEREAATLVRKLK